MPRDRRPPSNPCGRLRRLLAILTAPGALAQQAADTIVTHGKILTVDAAFRTVEALAITNGRIVATGTSAEIARYAGRNTKVIDVAGATVIPGLIDNHFHFTRGVDTWHQQARFEGVDSRREALRILAAKAASLTARRLDHGAGGLDAAAVRRRARRLHARGARRRGAEESAVRAGGLQRRLREQPRAQGGRAEPGGRRASQRAGSRVVPAAVCAVRRDAPDLARAARAEPHRFHARAQLDRPHGRLQPGSVRLRGRARGEGPAAGPAVGDAEFQRRRSGVGRQGRGAHRAHAPEPVRRPARHLRPGRGALRAVLRSRAAQGSLARRRS